jgi:hypothetical protein
MSALAIAVPSETEAESDRQVDGFVRTGLPDLGERSALF